MTAQEARAAVVEVFDSSAAMPGNERAFEAALNEFEAAIREDARHIQWERDAASPYAPFTRTPA